MPTSGDDLNIYSADDNYGRRDLMRKELVNVGFSIADLGKYTIATTEAGFCWLNDAESSFQSYFTFRATLDKILFRDFMKLLKVSYAEGYAYSRDDASKARQMVQRLGRAVLKPTKGFIGRGVSVDVNSSMFEAAWDSAWKYSSARVMVERFFEGEEARYLVLDGKCIAVLRRIPPAVTGNGTSTIIELIEAKNRIRAANPYLRKKPIAMDSHRMAMLQARGLDLDYLPELGEKIPIDSKGNIATGADSEDITDVAHSDYRDIVEYITSKLPNPHIIGYDVLSKDHTSPASPDSYIVVEGNTGSDLMIHYYPMFGQRRNVFRMLAQSCMDRLNTTFEGRPD
jgi:D-alanine-D-alanine ligase-like ATP-grasp enzyme